METLRTAGSGSFLALGLVDGGLVRLSSSLPQFPQF